MQKRLKRIKPKTIAAAIGIFSLWTGLLVAMVLMRTQQDLRQQASTVETAQLKLYTSDIDTTIWDEDMRTLVPGEKISVLVESQPHTLDVTAIDLVLRYKPDFFTAPEIKILDDTFGVLLKKEIDEVAGTVRIAVGRDPKKVLSGDQRVVQLTLTTLEKIGATQITIDPVATKIAALSHDANVYASDTPPLDISVKNPDLPSTKTSLQMKFKYAGAPVENNVLFLKDGLKTQKVKVSLENVATAEVTPVTAIVTTFTPDTGAAKKHYFSLAQPWTSGILQDGTYQILVKGPMHQQIRFCKEGQTRDYRCGAREGFSLAAAESFSFDLTARPLACGDLPISGTKSDQQDGAVRVTDYSFMLNCLSKRNDAACIARADCNGDESVTNLDMDLLLDTLSRAYDE